jgi:2-iminobutanoate/2-iminopropanoate deaminase
METAQIDPVDAPKARGAYTQALAVRQAERLLFISGQVPETADGQVPDDFEGQCRQVWANILACLKQDGLDAQNLVKVTTFLAGRNYADANSRIRREVLGDHRPALTVIIADIYDDRWLLEVEAIAAA